MTQPIQGNFRPPGDAVSRRASSVDTPAEAPATSGPGAAASAAPGVAVARPQTGRAASESVELSDAAERMVSDPVFDRDRVEAIKQSLREGSYPLNARRTAESFLALERWIDD